MSQKEGAGGGVNWELNSQSKLQKCGQSSQLAILHFSAGFSNWYCSEIDICDLDSAYFYLIQCAVALQ